MTVNEDWTGFKLTDEVKELFVRSAECIRKISDRISAEVVDESSEDALAMNRTDLQSLGRGAQREVAEFTHAVASAIPTASPDFLAAAAAAVINLHKSKSGAALLQKMSLLPLDDVAGLDRLLDEWSIKDALRVLDEIDSRLGVIETIRRIAGDKATDELHTLHPLILRSRWLFGPEFESEEYRSNSTLKTIARQLFADPDAQFINDRHRPDIVALPKKVTTIQLTGVEAFDHEDNTLVKIRSVLLLELKKGDFEITRIEMTQADGYVQDIATGITPRPYISAWVVGHKIDSRIALEKKLGDGDSSYGQVRATTYDRLVDTANQRLLRLRDHLAERYADIPTDKLLSRVFSRPAQSAADFGVSSTATPPEMVQNTTNAG